ASGSRASSSRSGHQSTGFSQLAKSSVWMTCASSFCASQYATLLLPAPPGPSTATIRVFTPSGAFVERTASMRWSTEALAGTERGECAPNSVAEERESFDGLVAEDEADVAVRDLAAPALHRRCGDFLFEQRVGDLHAVESQRGNVEEQRPR